MAKAKVLTVGCRLNQAESDALKNILCSAGYEICNRDSQPDLCVINTCTVTKAADRTSVNYIRRMANLTPKPKIIVTGCLLARKREIIDQIRGVETVLTMAEKEWLITDQSVRTDRSRPFLKIQDGCPNSCSFCIASRIRGTPRSKPITDIKCEIESLRDRGYGEVVLVGLNLGAWGIDCHNSLAALLRTLAAIRNSPRIRLGSLEPDAITDDLIDLWNEVPLCRHFHIPLQSGSDRVLAAMGRKYTGARYAELFARVSEKIPAAAIGADVIVGYPGEDESEFEKTRELLERLSFAYFHVFSYSPRPGTPAFDLGDPVSKSEKRRRSRILRDLGDTKSAGFRRRFVGQVLPGIVETRSRALTDNYIRVEVQNGGPVPAGGQSLVAITSIEGEHVFGEWRR